MSFRGGAAHMSFIPGGTRRPRTEGHPMTADLSTAEMKSLDSGGLAMAILNEVSVFDPDGLKTVMDALSTATYLHRNQTRANRAGLPRTPYSEHPLRNALRVLREGVTDLDIVVAVILHDTVEDCARDIVEDYRGFRAAQWTPGQLREAALGWTEGTFGAEVRRLVEAVSNPLTDTTKLSREAKNTLYAAHVAAAIHNDAAVFLVKLTDFVDNAAGLHHNAAGIGAGVNDGMVSRLAAKYLPVAEIFEAELAANYGAIMALVSAEGMEALIEHILSAKATLPALVKLAA